MPHLLDWLLEAGPTEQGAMGSAPLSWQTIDAWSHRTAARLTPWEARTLRRMSVRYHGELYAAEDPHRPAPWSPVPTEVDLEANERQLRAVLG